MELSTQCPYPLSLVLVATQCFLEKDLIQLLCSFSKRFLLIRFPKKGRVFEPRLQDPFVPLADSPIGIT